MISWEEQIGNDLQQVEVRTPGGGTWIWRRAEDRQESGETLRKVQKGGSRDLPALPEPGGKTCQKHQGHDHRQEDQAHGAVLLCGFGAQRVSIPIHPGLTCTYLVLFPPITLCLTNHPSSFSSPIPAHRWTLQPTLCFLLHLQDPRTQLSIS